MVRPIGDVGDNDPLVFPLRGGLGPRRDLGRGADSASAVRITISCEFTLPALMTVVSERQPAWSRPAATMVPRGNKREPDSCRMATGRW